MSSEELADKVDKGPVAPSRADELRSFLFLTVVLAPVVAVATVGGYGFLVWMTQILTGPPTQ
ncbi:MAG: periplasmic nitrate reductase, NapE protein [Stappiaceae bacterium]